MVWQAFDAEKGIEALLYIAEQCPDMYTALKVMYFADKEHLARYGKLICGDSYIAMRYGPVPSGMYDLIKAVRGDGACPAGSVAASAFAVRNNQVIVPHRKANLDLLEASDIECLDTAIKRYGRLPFEWLKRLSHDSAYQVSNPNDRISLESLIESLAEDEDFLAYFQDSPRRTSR